MTRPAHVPARRVIDYDAFGSEAIEQMHQKIDVWRRQGSVLWTDHNGGHWVVISAAAVRQVLADPARFHSSEPRKGVTLMDIDRPLSVPIEMDGAEHREYRRVLLPLFSPKRVRLLEDNIRQVARSLIAAFSPDGRCDIVRDYARPLASTMFLRLIDWPLEDRELLEELSDRYLNGLPGETVAERARTKVDASTRLSAYARAQVALRSSRSGVNSEDMTLVLMESVLEDGAPIAAEKLIELLRLLLIAGLDTTQSVLSQSFAELGRSPELQGRFRERREQIPTMVEEFLRWTAPAMPNRTATVDTEIDGVRVAAGDTVHCIVAAANRDDSETAEAGTLDLDRSQIRHLAFSSGPHHCVGAALARVVLASALDEFHQAVSEYRVVAAESHVGSAWGMKRVELAFDPVETA